MAESTPVILKCLLDTWHYFSRARVLHPERLTTSAPWVQWKKLWRAAAQTFAPACALLVLWVGVHAGNAG